MKLLPHQTIDAAFLADRKFAGCFNDMGSGKTLTALEAARLVGFARMLIIGPPISMPMWKAEVERFLGRTVSILKTGKATMADTDVVICSYAIATTRHHELREAGFDILIADESHALKDISAKRTKAVLGRGGIVEGIRKNSWMLTGTPMTRWADDFFPFLVRAANGKLAEDIGGMSLTKFQIKYCVRQSRQVNTRWGSKQIWQTVGSRNLDQLNELIFDNGLAVRRQIEEVHAAMPPITYSDLTVNLASSAEFTAANAEMKGKSVAQLAQMVAAGGQHLATLRRLLGLAKVPATAKLIKDRIDDGLGPILVGAWHHEVIDALREELGAEGVMVYTLTGKDSAERKQAVVEQFNTGGIDVLIGQIGAMGVSLNLQKLGHRIVLIEQDWSPAVMAQMVARIYRMGQEKHVHVDTVMSTNKLDAAVSKILARKSVAHARVLEQDV